MARPPKPWFWKSRCAWFVTLNGQRIKLHEEKEPAFRRFHEMMAQPEEVAQATDCVAAVIDTYLDWVQLHRAEQTYNWYLRFLQAFVDSLPPMLLMKDLKPWHVQRWVDKNKDLAPSTRRSLITCVKRAMRWAEEQGYIDRSPLVHLKKPEAGRRETILTPEQFEALMSHISDECFRDLLHAAWDTGARPQELTRLEARHFDAAHSRWVFPMQEAKTKKRPRIIYLTERVEEITRRRIDAQGEGLVFRNTIGTAWDKDSVGCRFQRLVAKVERRYCLYHFRHSFATRKLQEGLDPLTVAELLGHSDPSMLAKVYQHLSHDPQHMLQKLRGSTLS